MFDHNTRAGSVRPPRRVRVLHMLAFGLVAVFWAGAVTCLLQAVNRIARSEELAARARALDALGSEASDEDRRFVIESLRGGMLKRL